VESNKFKKLTIFLIFILGLISQPGKASAWSYTIADDDWWNGIHYNLEKFEFFMITESTF
jgi:hypothetical protein